MINYYTYISASATNSLHCFPSIKTSNHSSTKQPCLGGQASSSNNHSGSGSHTGAAIRPRLLVLHPRPHNEFLLDFRLQLHRSLRLNLSHNLNQLLLLEGLRNHRHRPHHHLHQENHHHGCHHHRLAQTPSQLRRLEKQQHQQRQ